jgi:hypothetical protein
MILVINFVCRAFSLVLNLFMVSGLSFSKSSSSARVAIERFEEEKKEKKVNRRQFLFSSFCGVGWLMTWIGTPLSPVVRVISSLAFSRELEWGLS